MWDFSSDIPTSIVPASAGPSLNLINFPARAVTSSNWDGSEMNWNHKPEHYRAIHFHEDDIYDFEWGTDFSFSIPGDMPSGIYIMHLECEDYRDAIPFFVCSPKANAKPIYACWSQLLPIRFMATMPAPTMIKHGKNRFQLGMHIHTMPPNIPNMGYLPTIITLMGRVFAMHLIAALYSMFGRVI